MGIMCSLLGIIKDNFQIQTPRGLSSEGLILGDIFEILGGLLFREAYTWRGLFLEFYGMLYLLNHSYFAP